MSDSVVKALETAITLCGGQTAYAERINEQIQGTKVKPIKQQRVWNWLHRDKKVPAEYAMPTEVITNGKVQASKLCPTVFLPRKSA
jgi:hypothetical protein